MILVIVVVYLIIGGILEAVLEERGYLEVENSAGYVLFPIFWLPIVLAVGSYILTKLAMKKRK